jgi:hypothetical protein
VRAGDPLALLFISGEPSITGGEEDIAAVVGRAFRTSLGQTGHT